MLLTSGKCGHESLATLITSRITITIRQHDRVHRHFVCALADVNQSWTIYILLNVFEKTV